MLLKFRVANVRSFREERELAFAVPAGKTAHASRQVPVAGGRQLDVYPLIGIFGPNASGKSNLLKGLVEMRTAVLDSYYQWATQRGVPRELFALDPAAERETSLYELDFVNDGIRYTYGFELARIASSPNGCTPIRAAAARSGSTATPPAASLSNSPATGSRTAPQW